MDDNIITNKLIITEIIKIKDSLPSILDSGKDATRDSLLSTTGYKKTNHSVNSILNFIKTIALCAIGNIIDLETGETIPYASVNVNIKNTTRALFIIANFTLQINFNIAISKEKSLALLKLILNNAEYANKSVTGRNNIPGIEQKPSLIGKPAIKIPMSILQEYIYGSTRQVYSSNIPTFTENIKILMINIPLINVNGDLEIKLYNSATESITAAHTYIPTANNIFPKDKIIYAFESDKSIYYKNYKLLTPIIPLGLPKSGGKKTLIKNKKLKNNEGTLTTVPKSGGKKTLIKNKKIKNNESTLSTLPTNSDKTRLIKNRKIKNNI
jgi:hypothetical protein